MGDHSGYNPPPPRAASAHPPARRPRQVDQSNVPAWQAWALLEERQGLLRKADDLRALCLQQRTEEVYLGVVDESVAAGIEALQNSFSRVGARPERITYVRD